MGTVSSLRPHAPTLGARAPEDTLQMPARNPRLRLATGIFEVYSAVCCFSLRIGFILKTRVIFLYKIIYVNMHDLIIFVTLNLFKHLKISNM